MLRRLSRTEKGLREYNKIETEGYVQTRRNSTLIDEEDGRVVDKCT
jgi:hypothetical protein